MFIISVGFGRDVGNVRFVVALGRGSWGMIVTLASIIVPVLLIAGLGYTWNRVGRSYDTEMVAALVTDIGVPCLVFHTLTTAGLDLEALSTMAGATVLVLAALLATGVTVLRLTRLPVRAFLPSLTIPNCGNIGLPLSLLAFGDQGLALAIAVFTVFSIFLFTGGVAIASGAASLKRLARLPQLYAVGLALLFIGLDQTPPEWLANLTRILGGMTIPLMLFTLGISLAKITTSTLRLGFALALVRLAVGFAAGLAVASLLDLEGVPRGVLILQASMPTAVFNYLFAQRYGTAPGDVAGIVVVSTVMSFATLPVLLWYLL